MILRSAASISCRLCRGRTYVGLLGDDELAPSAQENLYFIRRLIDSSLLERTTGECRTGLLGQRSV